MCVITSSFTPPPPTGVAERHRSSASAAIRRRLNSSMNARARMLFLPEMLAKVAPVARNADGRVRHEFAVLDHHPLGVTLLEEAVLREGLGPQGLDPVTTRVHREQ